MKSFFNAIKNYVNFKGSASRSDFWFFVLQYMILEIILWVIPVACHNAFLLILPMLINAALIIPCLAITFRRMHDAGFSGFCSFIPFYRIYLLCCSSVEEKYPNTNHNNAKVVGIIFLIISAISIPVGAGISASMAAAGFRQYKEASKKISATEAENNKIIYEYWSQRKKAREKLAESQYSAEATAEFKAEQEKILKALIEENKDNPDREIVVKFLTETLNELQKE